MLHDLLAVMYGGKIAVCKCGWRGTYLQWKAHRDDRERAKPTRAGLKAEAQADV